MFYTPQAAFTLAAFILTDPTETPNELRTSLICELRILRIYRLIRLKLESQTKRFHLSKDRRLSIVSCSITAVLVVSEPVNSK
jgi:hypothetical protein